jgi:hypothetical protein
VLRHVSLLNITQNDQLNLDNTWRGSNDNGALAREQYANIEKPRIDQTSPHQPKAPVTQARYSQQDPLTSNHFGNSVGGPEKAGVGGSIPSLATNTFNNLAIAKNIQISSREQYANLRLPYGLVLADWFK